MTRRKLAVEAWSEFIGPERALELLNSNTNPRGKGIVLRDVCAYARVMLTPQWVPTLLLLDEKRRLLDGFTRLTAVVQIQKKVEFIVVSGLPAQIAKALDNGRRRPGAINIAEARGDWHYAKFISSLVAGIVRYPHRQTVCILNTDLPVLYDLYREAVEWIVSVFAGHNEGHVKMPVIYAFAHAYLAKAQTPERLTQLAESYRDQMFDDQKDPLRLLCSRVIRDMASTTRLPAIELYLLATRAIQAACDGEQIGVLKASQAAWEIDSPL